MASRLPFIRQLVVEAKEEEACEAIVDLYRKEQDGDCKLVWNEPFFPAAEFRIKIDLANVVSDYKRSLDFASGKATVRFNADDRSYIRRTFVSRAAQACVIHLDSGFHPADNELSLGNPLFTEDDAEFIGPLSAPSPNSLRISAIRGKQPSAFGSFGERIRDMPA